MSTTCPVAGSGQPRRVTRPSFCAGVHRGNNSQTIDHHAHVALATVGSIVLKVITSRPAEVSARIVGVAMVHIAHVGMRMFQHVVKVLV